MIKNGNLVDDLVQYCEDAVNGVVVDLPCGEDVCDSTYCGYRGQAVRAAYLSAELALRAAAHELQMTVHETFPKLPSRGEEERYELGVLACATRLNRAADNLMGIREKL